MLHADFVVKKHRHQLQTSIQMSFGHEVTFKERRADGCYEVLLRKIAFESEIQKNR